MGVWKKQENIPYHQRPYASIAERTLVDISIYSPRPQIAGTGHSHSKISIHSPRMGRDEKYHLQPITIDISIHSPRMGRDGHHQPKAGGGTISIHSPRMGRDLTKWGIKSTDLDFNPLSPHGERPPPKSQPFGGIDDFNPLSPHGERLRDGRKPCRLDGFQSTLPAWGETQPDQG